MKEIVKKFNDIAFVWTYECNTDCEYCFSTRYIEPYKNISLSFDTYKEILNKIVENWVNSVSFIWWEPALWPEINNAIRYAKEKWIKTTVFSNAMIKLKEKPGVFFIHLNVLFLTKNKTILENLYEYSKDSKIVFIYNVYKPNKYSLKLLLKILESFRFDFAISFNIVFDDKIDKTYWDFIYNAYNYITSKMNKDVMSSWPLPHCIFKDELINFLKDKKVLEDSYWAASFANTDVFFTVVNPDGKSSLSCAPINIKMDISYLLKGDYSGYVEKYSEIFWPILKQENSFCSWCKKFNKECQYGWVVNLYNSPEIKI